MQRAWDMAGAAFFRARSFGPLPVIALVIWLSWRAHITPGPGGPTVDLVLNGVGLLACLGGALVRLLTVASVPAGTSSQSRKLQSHALNVTGPYAAVRHPLYFGNLLITTGLLCIAHDAWAWALGLGYFAVSHVLIIRAEESLLQRSFGAAWEEWAAQVPPLFPKVSKLGGFFQGPFAWKRAVQREVNPLVGWGMGATLLLMWEAFARSELTTRHGKVGLGVLAAFLVLLIANKVWKKVSRA